VARLEDAAAEPWLLGSHTAHHECFPADLPSWLLGSHVCHHQCFPPVLPSLHDGTHGNHSRRCTYACCAYSMLTRYRQESRSPCWCICACCHLLRLMVGPCMRCFNQFFAAWSEGKHFHHSTSNTVSGSCSSRLLISLVDDQENVEHQVHLCFRARMSV